jgi:hypothetical protein
MRIFLPVARRSRRVSRLLRSAPLVGSAVLLLPRAAPAFCGFYVASGDAKLFNHASQVVLVRDQDRTVLSMANDYKGEPKKFALVVPVPTVVRKEQVRVVEQRLIDRLDAYSAPRLVEYHDPDPCPEARVVKQIEALQFRGGRGAELEFGIDTRSAIQVLDRYTVEEYDIVILDARQSGALVTWLNRNGYRIPRGASRVLASYIKQGTKFFVAKVNLAEHERLGFQKLRPLQVSFTSPKFVLPVRLGTVNADGPQELFVYALTRNGRVETINYRTTRVPTDLDLPAYVKDEFPTVYRALFERLVARDGMSAVYTEYVWNVATCDPCPTTPPTREELAALGVDWLDRSATIVTRLHTRYDGRHFPEDLVLQETPDQQPFQGRYVLRHEWKGDDDCPAARVYRAQLADRRARAARNLADLTGWRLGLIRTRMGVNTAWEASTDRVRWWQRLWRN